MSPKTSGYSGTSLVKKLGIVEGSRVVTKNAPQEYVQLLQLMPAGVSFGSRVTNKASIVHIFCARRAGLVTQLTIFGKSFGEIQANELSEKRK